MENAAPATTAEEVSRSKQFGRVFGKELKGLVTAARRPFTTSASSDGADPTLGKFGQKYEDFTGRDARADGRIACLAGVGVAAVVGAGMAIAAASQVVVTGIVVGVGVAGVAACCKVTGHDREYETIVNTSTTVVSKVVTTTRDFAGGMMEAVSGDAAADPAAPGGSGAAPQPGQPAAQPVEGAAPPPSAGSSQPLYPVVHAPAPPRSDDLISLMDDQPKRPKQ